MQADGNGVDEETCGRVVAVATAMRRRNTETGGDDGKRVGEGRTHDARAAQASRRVSGGEKADGSQKTYLARAPTARKLRMLVCARENFRFVARCSEIRAHLAHDPH